MTSFYSWRLMFMTFYGKTRAEPDTYKHAHESPPVMLMPLYVLATGAVLAGIVFAPYFIGTIWPNSGDPRDAGQGDHAPHA